MTEDPSEDGYLAGQLLVAMPQMLDERFVKTVIYMCAHTEDGAMGLVVNKILDDIDFPDLLDQLDLRPSSGGDDIQVHFGGPVEAGRGFVLHSSDYRQEATMVIDEQIALTATTDILRDIAGGDEPKNGKATATPAGSGTARCRDPGKRLAVGGRDPANFRLRPRQSVAARACENRYRCLHALR